jgi:adenine-specific DNA-methyltransferase
MTDDTHLDLTSHNLPADKTAELLRLFPEIRTEGDKIDFDKLKLVLGQSVDVGRERYGMNWPGKAECFKTIQTPSMGTLLPVPAESVDFDTTENLIIEGDNLEALKLLQKAYLGKVKMIYIDPPYNTGNDFIYPDNYTESLQTYLEYTGQVDAEGRKFGTNADTDGRFHSRWLNMMYPRLYLARNLLRDDGVIFISIDDTEYDNLKKLCNEVFGEENFVASVIWQKVYSPRMDDNGISPEHDFILIYSKSLEFVPNRMPFEQNLKQFTGVDEQTGQNYRPRSLRKEGKNSRREDRPNLYYSITAPDDSAVFPMRSDGSEGCWRMGKIKYEKLLADGLIEWIQVKGNWQPMVKQFYDTNATRPYMTIWTHNEVGHNHSAVDELKKLMNTPVFDNPKPSGLIKRALDISTGKGESDDDDEGNYEQDIEIVLDFFSGSGTTAQAVLEKNAEDNGNRKFILVQLPEPTDNKNFPTIADITKERVRRVIQKLNAEEAGQLPLTNYHPDRGFRVFKLAESNFKAWQASTPKDKSALEKQLELHIDHIRDGRTSDDILYEILLKSGFPLTTPVEVLSLRGGVLPPKQSPENEETASSLAVTKVYSVASGGMLICLEKELTLEVIRAMAEMKPQRVVCLDLGFAGNDQLKTNAVQIFKNKEIVFKTV